ncbi:hypothetical protein Aple_065520 [Acrocarpospora pleiomorpha]|uniref:Uncharacterized protein n=1 Tax=Acrocarpospora pleiomorpha TaxID=90975 RepID=A0A5M3XWC7_9ACTN|nr:hypothetical protein Aple_065520 [Acrocarpospora pleiomorpha]
MLLLQRNFFTGRLLRNPRLLYLWHARGGKIGLSAEEITHDIYAKTIGDIDISGRAATMSLTEYREMVARLDPEKLQADPIGPYIHTPEEQPDTTSAVPAPREPQAVQTPTLMIALACLASLALLVAITCVVLVFSL